MSRPRAKHPSTATTQRDTSPAPLATDEPGRPRANAAAGRYGSIIDAMKRCYDVRVKRWRTQMSGCAWRVYHHDGRVANWIEAPYPRTPISLAIFLHECGHHVIGFQKYKKRCEEEYHVWVWAIAEMRRLGVEPDARVMRRFELSMQYAVGKALRRGIKHLPQPLMQFAPPLAA